MQERRAGHKGQVGYLGQVCSVRQAGLWCHGTNDCATQKTLFGDCVMIKIFNSGEKYLYVISKKGILIK